MSVCILEVLQSAEHNIQNTRGCGLTLGLQQLHNAIILLGKGYGVYGDFDDIVRPHNGNVEDVPEREDEI